MELGALDSAARRFIDYWMGPGTWAGMPSHRRIAIAQAMPGVRSQWSAIFAEETPLTHALPNVTTAEPEGAGHMTPVTHPEIVNAMIEAYIAQ